MRARYVLAAAAVAGLAACQPTIEPPTIGVPSDAPATAPGDPSTTQELDPLRVTFTPHCDQADGLDIVVENIGDGTVPVTVSFGDAIYDPSDYATPTRWVPAGDDTVYSFPGSHPPQATIRIGGESGVGWITEDLTYCGVPR